MAIGLTNQESSYMQSCLVYRLHNRGMVNDANGTPTVINLISSILGKLRTNQLGDTNFVTVPVNGYTDMGTF